MPKVSTHVIERAEFPLENDRQFTNDGRIATHVHPGAGHIIVNEQTGETFPSVDYQGVGVQPLLNWMPHEGPEDAQPSPITPKHPYVNYNIPIDMYTFQLEETDSVKYVTSGPMTTPPTYDDIDVQLFTFASFLTHQYQYQQYITYFAAIDDPTGYRDYLSLPEVASWIYVEAVTTLLEDIPTTGSYVDGIVLWNLVPEATKTAILAEWDAYWTAHPPDPVDYGRKQYNQDVPGKSGWDYSLHRYYKILYEKLTPNLSGDQRVNQQVHVLRDYLTEPVWPLTNQLCIEMDSVVTDEIDLPKADMMFSFGDLIVPPYSAVTPGTCPYTEGGATTAYDQEHDETITFSHRQWTVKFTPFGLKWTVVDTAKSWTRSCYWIFDGWTITHVFMGDTALKTFTPPNPILNDAAKYAALQVQYYEYTAHENWAQRRWEDQGDGTSFNFFHERWHEGITALSIKLGVSPVGSGYFDPFTFDTIIT